MQIGNPIGKLTSTRGGAVALGIGAAVIAAILLAVYITHYRSSVDATAAPAVGLVAKNLIPKGTPGSLIATRQQYQQQAFTKDTLKAGAITDPSILTGRVATTDIYPGQQLTIDDFTSSAAGALNTKFTGAQRAVTLSMDATRGSLANVSSGDHVDVYQQLTGPQGTIVKLFRPNVLVLQAPGAAGGNVVFQVPTKDVADFLYAASNTTLSFAIRPAAQAAPTVPEVADQKSMLTFTHPR